MLLSDFGPAPIDDLPELITEELATQMTTWLSEFARNTGLLEFYRTEKQRDKVLFDAVRHHCDGLWNVVNIRKMKFDGDEVTAPFVWGVITYLMAETGSIFVYSLRCKALCHDAAVKLRNSFENTYTLDQCEDFLRRVVREYRLRRADYYASEMTELLIAEAKYQAVRYLISRRLQLRRPENLLSFAEIQEEGDDIHFIDDDRALDRIDDDDEGIPPQEVDENGVATARSTPLQSPATRKRPREQ